MICYPDRLYRLISAWIDAAESRQFTTGVDVVQSLKDQGLRTPARLKSLYDVGLYAMFRTVDVTPTRDPRRTA